MAPWDDQRKRTARISVPVTEEEKAILEAAAERLKATGGVSGYIRDTALIASGAPSTDPCEVAVEQFAARVLARIDDIAELERLRQFEARIRSRHAGDPDGYSEEAIGHRAVAAITDLDNARARSAGDR